MAVERVISGGVSHPEHWRSSHLWQALASMRIEPEGAPLTFAMRLAKENGWSRAYAEAVADEYRRFIYLAATAAEPVTPSDEVDQAWHLHLAYTRHYWDVLCAEILKRPLHHGPTAGGEIECSRYRRQYAETLERYRRVFQAAPPAAIWPAPRERFLSCQVRIDTSRYWLVPKALPSRGAVLAGSGLIAACSTLTAAGGGSGERLAISAFLTVALLSVVVAAAFFSARAARKKNEGAGGSCGGGGGGDSNSNCSGGGGDCAGGCGGGCGGCS